MVAPLSRFSVTSPQVAPAGRNLWGDVILIEDRLDGQCVRHVHLMSNEVIGLEVLRAYGISTVTATVEQGETAGSYWLRASGPCRLVWNVDACVAGKFRRLVAWSLEGCESVRGAIGGAARDFELIFGFAPKYAFVKRLPRGTEDGMDVSLTPSPSPDGRGESLILLEAEWMMERCVAVGGRATPPPTRFDELSATPPQMGPSTASGRTPLFAQDNLGRGE